MYQLQRILLCTGLLLVISGCGGGEDEESAQKPKQTAVKPTAVAGAGNKPKPVGAATANNRNQPRNRSRTPNKEPEKNALPPGTSPEDVFITQADMNTFEVAATAEELNTFTVVSKPADGADSGTFEPPVLHRTRSLQGSENRYKQPARISVQTGQSEGSSIERLPEGFAVVRGSEKHESGMPTRVRNKETEMEFVLIPAGKTIRGSDVGPANTRPAHQVYLDPYYISVREVTLREWELFREAERENDRLRQPSTPLNEGDSDDMPVLGIPQLEARQFAEWLKCDLPTEAQWEKAARGPEGYVYPWGDGRPIWSRPRQKGAEIMPVMSWRNDVSTYGVYDLAGNAREWTLDVYREDYYAFEAGEEGEKLVENPTGPRTGAGAYDRVIRGGGEDWKVWSREGARFSEQIPDVGFRLVINPDPESEEEDPETTRRTRNRRR